LQEPQALTVLEVAEVETQPQAAQAVQVQNMTPHTAPVLEVVEVVGTQAQECLVLAAQEASTEVVVEVVALAALTGRLAEMVPKASSSSRTRPPGARPLTRSGLYRGTGMAGL
jgi:hypothetical protein